MAVWMLCTMPTTVCTHGLLSCWSMSRFAGIICGVMVGRTVIFVQLGVVLILDRSMPGFLFFTQYCSHVNSEVQKCACCLLCPNSDST